MIWAKYKLTNFICLCWVKKIRCRVRIIYTLWCIWCKALTAGSTFIHYHLFLCLGSRLNTKFSGMVIWERYVFFLWLSDGDGNFTLGWSVALLSQHFYYTAGKVSRELEWMTYLPECWLSSTSCRWILNETGAITKEKYVLSTEIISHHVLKLVSHNRFGEGRAVRLVLENNFHLNILLINIQQIFIKQILYGRHFSKCWW